MRLRKENQLKREAVIHFYGYGRKGAPAKSLLILIKKMKANERSARSESKEVKARLAKVSAAYPGPVTVTPGRFSLYRELLVPIVD